MRPVASSGSRADCWQGTSLRCSRERPQRYARRDSRCARARLHRVMATQFPCGLQFDSVVELKQALYDANAVIEVTRKLIEDSRISDEDGEKTNLSFALRHASELILNVVDSVGDPDKPPTAQTEERPHSL